MCQFETDFTKSKERFPELEDCLSKLDEMESDGLITRTADQLKVLEKGRPFVRNVCMALYLRLHRKAPKTQVFSITI